MTPFLLIAITILTAALLASLLVNSSQAKIINRIKARVEQLEALDRSEEIQRLTAEHGVRMGALRLEIEKITDCYNDLKKERGWGFESSSLGSKSSKRDGLPTLAIKGPSQRGYESFEGDDFDDGRELMTTKQRKRIGG